LETDALPAELHSCFFFGVDALFSAIVQFLLGLIG
jgi:hypothetical protein